MSEDVLVSALLPVHAGLDPDHLRRCLDSVAEQTRPPDELIVVEDGPLAGDHPHVLVGQGTVLDDDQLVGWPGLLGDAVEAPP